MIVRKVLFVGVILTVLLFAIGASMSRSIEQSDHFVASLYPVTAFEDPVGDPLPVTEFDPAVATGKVEAPVFPNMEQLKIIGRLAEGIPVFARNRGGGKWFECGRAYSPEEEQDIALEWAYRIVFLAWEYSDNGSDDGVILNPWGVAGTAANECGFDRCALGTWPRKWAYNNGYLKPKRRNISHTKEEILAAVKQPKAIESWKRTGIDSGPLHELWQCNKEGCRPKYNRSLPRISFEEVFSLGKGFEYNVRQMKKRALHNRTDRPWLYWRGYRCEWYDEKVTRWARKLGATKEEIGSHASERKGRRL